MSIAPVRSARALVLAAAALGAGVPACERLAGGDERAPRLIVAWTGSDTGKLAARVVAEWCDSLQALEIRGVQGDSGLALLLYPRGALRADSYPVLLPDRADSTRPSAAVAARWFGETSLKGFQGERGAVVLTEGGTRVSGRVQARMRSINDAARLQLEGTFTGVPVSPAGRGGVARPHPQGGDTG